MEDVLFLVRRRIIPQISTMPVSAFSSRYDIVGWFLEDYTLRSSAVAP